MMLLFYRGLIMTTKKQLEDALKKAMRARDDVRKRTLRMVLSAIKLSEVEKGEDLDNSEIMAVLQKEVKSRRESVTDAQRAGRSDLVDAAEAEIKVLEEYLPEQLTPDQLELMAKEAIDKVGATSLREMGQVMKVLMPRIQGQATGKQASQIVRKLLQ
jgi:uncharacterized protein YqeY